MMICKDCKAKFDTAKEFKLPKIRNPKEFNVFCVCPKCGSGHLTKGGKANGSVD